MILDEEGSPRNNLFLISVDSRKKNCFTVASSRVLLAKLKVDKLQVSKGTLPTQNSRTSHMNYLDRRRRFHKINLAFFIEDITLERYYNRKYSD